MAESDMRRPVHLDTDIGTDVDDLLALALLVAAPEVRLIGVTTVYGDTVLRARMTRLVLDQLERRSVPIGIGAQETLSGRLVWWAGHEGQGILGLDRVQIDEGTTAADLLHQAATEHRGRLELFAIGPLTNVAEAISADESFAKSLRHLYIMGGAFWMEQAEHNIKSDPEAADIVFRSGIPMTICGLDVTQRVRLREADMSQIREAPVASAWCWRIRSAAGGRTRERPKITCMIPWRSCRRFVRNCSALSSAMCASRWRGRILVEPGRTDAAPARCALPRMSMSRPPSRRSCNGL